MAGGQAAWTPSKRRLGARGRRRLFDLGNTYRFEVTFGKQGTAPVPVRKAIKSGDRWIAQHWEQGRLSALRVGTARGAWELEVPVDRGASVIAWR